MAEECQSQEWCQPHTPWCGCPSYQVWHQWLLFSCISLVMIFSVCYLVVHPAQSSETWLKYWQRREMLTTYAEGLEMHLSHKIEICGSQEVSNFHSSAIFPTWSYLILCSVTALFFFETIYQDQVVCRWTALEEMCRCSSERKNIVQTWCHSFLSF